MAVANGNTTSQIPNGNSSPLMPGDCFTAEEFNQTLNEAFQGTVNPDLACVLNAISRSVVDIGGALRSQDQNTKFAAKQVGTQNTFGDDQLEIDVTSDKAVFDRLKQSGVVAVASSEETTDEVKLLEDGGQNQKQGQKQFGVAFDPLDGSSIVDSNFTVGSIFGVWEGDKLLGRTGREQKAAVMAMYGPRITMAVAVNDEGCKKMAVELTYSQGSQSSQGRWQITKAELKIAAEGKVFAPGNLRATCDNPKYKELCDFWTSNAYTLRYTGGMVPDVYHILFKGKGVFTNVSSAKAKAKLRLLYECAPIALIVELSGGRSSVDPVFVKDLGGKPQPCSVLDLVVDDLDKRVGICYGSSVEVDRFEKMLY